MPYAKHLEDAALPQADDHRRAPFGRCCDSAMAEFVMPNLGRGHGGRHAGRLAEAARATASGAATSSPRSRPRRALIDVEIFTSGVLERILVQPGQKVPVGTVLARHSGGAAQRAATPRPPAPPARSRRRPAGCGSLRSHGSSRPSSASIRPRSRAPAPDGAITPRGRRTSRGPAGAVESSRRTAPFRRRSTARPRCDRPSPRPWRARSARFRTTTWAPRSTCTGTDWLAGREREAARRGSPPPRRPPPQGRGARPAGGARAERASGSAVKPIRARRSTSAWPSRCAAAASSPPRFTTPTTRVWTS